MYINLLLTDGAYGGAHLIWIGIVFVIAVSGMVLIGKFKPSLKTLMIIMLCVSLVSELMKYTYFIQMTYEDTGHYVLSKLGLPFQLCSIQPFFILAALLTKKENVRHTLLAFVFATGVFSGILPIFIVTISSCSFASYLAYEYFIYHACLLTFGLSIVVYKYVDIHAVDLGHTILILLAVFIGSIYMNSMLSSGGSFYNFCFTADAPIDGLPYLNLNQGYVMYILKYVLLALTLEGLIHLPFIIKDLKAKNKVIKA